MLLSQEHSIEKQDLQLRCKKRAREEPKCPTSIEDTRTALESGTFNVPAEMVFAFRNDVIMVTFRNNFSFLNDRSLFGDGTFK